MSNTLQELFLCSKWQTFNHCDFHTDRALDGNVPILSISEYDIYTNVTLKYLKYAMLFPESDSWQEGNTSEMATEHQNSP